jgi:hypothetical protein
MTTIKQAETKLEKAVETIINDHIEDMDEEETQNWFEDLAQHGCSSGMVRDLIHYTDTVAFYEEHQDEIDQMVADSSRDLGLQPIDMFNQNLVERDDPLFRGDINKNVLAWFAFEETARNLANEAGYDI